MIRIASTVLLFAALSFVCLRNCNAQQQVCNGYIAPSGVCVPSGLAANRPAAPVQGQLYYVIDASSATDCTAGGGSSKDLCIYNGTTWVSTGTAGGSGTVTSVATSSPLTGGPITTTGTVGIQTASGSQAGALSSADWTTFNNKQASLTNPVTGTGTANTLTKFTNTSTVGNSGLTDDGTTQTSTENLDLSGGNMRPPAAGGFTPTSTHTFGQNSTDGHFYYWNLNAAASAKIPNTSDLLGITGIAQNEVLASPDGSSGTAAFRALVKADLPNNSIVKTTVSSGAIGSLSGAFSQIVICTATCDLTPLTPPAAGYQLCVFLKAGVTGTITLDALGSSSFYPKADSSGFGTAGTGTMVSSSGLGRGVCLVGEDATHYDLANTKDAGTDWTVN